MAFSATNCLIALLFSFNLAVNPSIGTGFQFDKPVSYLVSNTFITCPSICSQLILLAAIASFVFAITVATSPGKHIMSTPAINDSTPAAPFGYASVTPFISNASVKTIPLKPISFFKSPVMAFSDTELPLLGALSITGINK